MRKKIIIGQSLSATYTAGCLVLALVFLSYAVPVFAGQDAGGPPSLPSTTFDQRLGVMVTLAEGIMPLFVLGDVNEDGLVDQTDTGLIRELARTGGRFQASSAISCPAAADLSMNGEIDQNDLKIMEDILKKGATVTTPALFFQEFLPCASRNMEIAAQPDVRPGGTMPIRFLDPSHTSGNCSVEVKRGKAKVKASADGHGYDVTTPPDAEVDGEVTVLIALPEGRNFLYTFPVRRSGAKSAHRGAAKP